MPALRPRAYHEDHKNTCSIGSRRYGDTPTQNANPLISKRNGLHVTHDLNRCRCRATVYAPTPLNSGFALRIDKIESKADIQRHVDMTPWTNDANTEEETRQKRYTVDCVSVTTDYTIKNPILSYEYQTLIRWAQQLYNGIC